MGPISEGTNYFHHLYTLEFNRANLMARYLSEMKEILYQRSRRELITKGVDRTHIYCPGAYYGLPNLGHSTAISK